MDKSKVDQEVMALLQKVRQKKEAIKTQKRPQWKTNCSYALRENPNQRINIQTVRDEDKLLDLAGGMLLDVEYKQKAADKLGLEFNQTINGYSHEDWLEDIQTRANMLKVEKEKREIEELDRRINKLVSSEQRREMELRELQELLKD